ncbi:PRC-barrel domain-containing protein [Minwuia sp.]|uniref:PRC-barrel domain-containing protein n=1 Tax=Minwuia sp. TaxID=2493630 RepID=UPI003A91EA8D
MNKKLMMVSAVSLTALMSAGAGVAQAESHKKADAMKPNVAEQCMKDVRTFETEFSEEGGVYDSTMRRDYRTLRDAALTFARYGDEEACENVLNEMRDLREKHADKQMMMDRREARKERLEASQPLDAKNRIVWAEDLIGDEVVNLQNEELGHVEDVAVGGSDGSIYIMVSHGGFLGLGETLTPVRITDLKQTEDADTLVLPIDAKMFQDAPEVDYSEEARRTAKGWSEDIGAWWDRNIKN